MDDFFKRFFPNDIDAVAGYHATLSGPLAKARMVLDCGCGANDELAAYRTPTRQVWGVYLQRHPQLAHPAWFRKLAPEGTIPFPSNMFDVIGARWVLEHVREPEAFLDEVKRVLRPGGTFVALTVNATHYTSLVARLANLLPHFSSRPAHDTSATWYRCNTQTQVRRLARRGGLELVEMQRFAKSDHFSFSKRLRQAAVLTDYALERAGTDLGRLHLVATLRKPVAATVAPLRLVA
jgi:SAM-dependent methyltransferase